jgi:hypothetical protein
MLAPIASVIARVMGDLSLVKHYSELRLACDPDDAMGLYTLADCLSVQGRAEEAKEIAGKAHRISLSQESLQGRDLAELIERRIPGAKVRNVRTENRTWSTRNSAYPGPLALARSLYGKHGPHQSPVAQPVRLCDEWAAESG